MKPHLATILFAAAALLSLASCSKDEKDEEPRKNDPIVGTWQATRWHGIDDTDGPYDYPMDPGEKTFVFRTDGTLTEMTRMGEELDYDTHYRWERNAAVEGAISVHPTDGSSSSTWAIELSDDNRQLSIFQIIAGFGSSEYECTRQ